MFSDSFRTAPSILVRYELSLLRAPYDGQQLMNKHAGSFLFYTPQSAPQRKRPKLFEIRPSWFKSGSRRMEKLLPRQHQVKAT
jgi:hypothetical protein